jgi:hypothetical protein
MALMDPLDLVIVMMQVLMCQDLGIHLWYLKVLVLSTLRRREMQPEMVVLLMMVMGRDLGVLTLTWTRVCRQGELVMVMEQQALRPRRWLTRSMVVGR